MITMNRNHNHCIAMLALYAAEVQADVPLDCLSVLHSLEAARCIRGLYHNVSIGSNER